MALKKSTQFIVIYDDDQGLCVPMSWDADCDGALIGFLLPDGDVAVFDSRADARKAIRISTAFAKLCREQGRPVNSDFLDGGLKYVRIVPLRKQG